jgi:hypothetical protein
MSGKTVPAEGRSIESEATADLVRQALDETRELVRLEVALARAELKSEWTQVRTGAIALGTAGGLGLAGFTVLLVAIAFAFPIPWLAALVVGAILLAVSGALAFSGYKALPRRPLNDTKERLESDLKQLKERIA